MSADVKAAAALAYQRGRERLDAGDLDGAIACFEQSANANPHFKTLELLGEALLRKGEPRRAVVPLAAATTLNRQSRAPSLLAEALLTLGERLQAYEIAQVALRRDPNNKTAKAVAVDTEAEYRRHHET